MKTKGHTEGNATENWVARTVLSRIKSELRGGRGFLQSGGGGGENVLEKGSLPGEGGRRLGRRAQGWKEREVEKEKGDGSTARNKKHLTKRSVEKCRTNLFTSGGGARMRHHWRTTKAKGHFETLA